VSRIDVATQTSSRRPAWTPDLNTLVTALYVQVDDLLKANPDRVPWRPVVGIAPRISDAELVTLAVAQALLGFTCEARWLRFGRRQLPPRLVPVPARAGTGTTSGCASWSAP
jgi:hypothetical protein